MEVSTADSFLGLSRGLDTTGFINSLYQWASTLTSSGQNMPFALPIKADKLDNGFQVSSADCPGHVIFIKLHTCRLLYMLK